MNGYQKRIEAKKRQIKNSALQLLEKYDLDRITVQQIAAHAKVSRATIYKHFENKEHLYFELFEEVINESIEAIEKVIEGEGSFLTKFHKITELKSRIFKITENSYVSLTLSNQGEIAGILSEKQKQKVQEMTDQLFDQGRSEGIVSGHISNEAIRDLLKVLRAGMRALKEEKDPIMNDLSRLMTLNDLFLNAIGNHGTDQQNG